MAELSKEYRPENHMLTCGATASEDSVLTYYYSDLPGLNTFLEHVARDRGLLDNKLDIPVRNINSILKENFPDGLDIVDIDTEGMDFELLEALDTDALNVKIICTEIAIREIKQCLESKGFTHYFTTKENHIYVKTQDLERILP